MTSTPTTKAPSTEEVYDDIGAAYEKAFDGLSTQQASIQWVLRELKQPSRILDIGCGTGRPVCEAFANAGHEVLGIDLSAVMIETAAKNVPNATFEKVDLKDFIGTANSDSFDAVTAYFSMLAGVTQDDIRRSIEGVARLLKPGGLFVFATVPIDANEHPMKWMGRPVVVSSLGVDEVSSLCSKAGFEIVQQETSKFLPKAVEAGLCTKEEVWEEPHLFVYAKKA